MSPRKAYLIYGLGCILCLAIGARQLPQLNQIRRENRFVDSVDLRNAPADYAVLATTLGGFRGVFVDVLWLRALRLEQQGRHFELVQLYDWIGRLEPRIEDIWALNAWNLAYNVAAATPRREERWQWIQRSIELLRDHGLRYNPLSDAIHREIAWTYFNKIGSRSDEFHWYYKTQLALDMQRTLGWGRPDLAAIAAAPETLPALIQREPTVSPFLEEASRLAIPLAQAHGELLWEDVSLTAEQRDFLQSQENRPKLLQLSAFHAAHALRQQWKMDPKRMLQIQKEYGPIDWRLPDAIALYWASLARDLSQSRKSIFEINAANRILYFSFVNLFRTGRLFFARQPEGKGYIYITQPEVGFADRLHRFFEEVTESVPHARAAHEAFLEELTYTLFTFNDKRRSRQYYEILARKYPNTRYQKPYDDYIMSRITTDLREASYEQTKAMITGLLVQHYQWSAIGEDDRALGTLKLAHRVWEHYTKARADTVSESEEPARQALPPLDELGRLVLNDVLFGPPDKRFAPLLRDRLQEKLGIRILKDGSTPGPVETPGTPHP